MRGFVWKLVSQILLKQSFISVAIVMSPSALCRLARGAFALVCFRLSVENAKIRSRPFGSCSRWDCLYPAPHGAGRFISTRLCGSQVLSIQNLFWSSFSGIKDQTPAFSRCGLRRIPFLCAVWTFLPAPFGTGRLPGFQP